MLKDANMLQEPDKLQYQVITLCRFVVRATPFTYWYRALRTLSCEALLRWDVLTECHSVKWMLFPYTLPFYSVDYAEQISTHFYGVEIKNNNKRKGNLSASEFIFRKKKGPTAERVPAGLLVPVAGGRMNELICSHCVSWIYSHTALWYPTSMGYCKLMTRSVKAHLHEIWTV